MYKPTDDKMTSRENSIVSQFSNRTNTSSTGAAGGSARSNRSARSRIVITQSGSTAPQHFGAPASPIVKPRGSSRSARSTTTTTTTTGALKPEKSIILDEDGTLVINPKRPSKDSTLSSFASNATSSQASSINGGRLVLSSPRSPRPPIHLFCFIFCLFFWKCRCERNRKSVGNTKGAPSQACLEEKKLRHAGRRKCDTGRGGRRRKGKTLGIKKTIRGRLQEKIYKKREKIKPSPHFVCAVLLRFRCRTLASPACCSSSIQASLQAKDRVVCRGRVSAGSGRGGATV